MLKPDMDTGPTNSPSGDHVVLDGASVEAFLRENPDLWKKSQHRPLAARQQQIIRHIVARVVGHDNQGVWLGDERLDKDLGAIEAINNALVLKSKDIESDLKEGGAHRKFEEYASHGFHVSELTRELLREVLKRRSRGYAILMEHQDDDMETPVGYQIGFSVIPSSNYRSLALNSLPPLSIFTEHTKDTMTIWRTGILYKIEQVRQQFEALGIPIHPRLEGQVLQRLGIGQATKYVDTIAAAELEKTYVQCNIGTIVRPGSPTDILAQNIASRGSNSEVFDETPFTRSCADVVEDDRGNPLVEVYWKLFRATPKQMLERLNRPDSALRVKGWDTQLLEESGKQLAQVIKSRPPKDK